jgi:hypothetical protein
MGNLQHESIDYQITETPFFLVRTYVYSTGASFREYVSHGRWGSLPLVHITLGKDPATGRRRIAYGVVAIGAIAVGIVPIGALAIGLFPLGWLAVGLFTAIGQAAIGLVAVGQLAIGPFFALGQVAVGYTAVGQVAIGYYALGQSASGMYTYDMKHQEYEAWLYFKELIPWLQYKE